jgi:DNA-binding MarR family transcriptional regulator
MSTPKKTKARLAQARNLPPPTFGALMRMTWLHVRRQMLEAIHEAGFPEFQEAHFAIFSYPLPDGVRPSDLARQRHMSRQAINYLLVQLEGLGYVERRTDEGEAADRRLVYLTASGWQIAEAIFGCLRRLQRDWAQDIGQERFDVFLEVLTELAAKAQEKSV